MQYFRPAAAVRMHDVLNCPHTVALEGAGLALCGAVACDSAGAISEADAAASNQLRNLCRLLSMTQTQPFFVPDTQDQA